MASRQSLNLRTPRLLIPAGLVIAAGALFVAAFPLADGEAAFHVQSHAAIGLGVALLAAVAAPLLPAPAAGWRRTVRLVLVGALWLVAGAQVLEGVSAFGFEGDDETVRVEALSTLHTVVLGPGAAWMPLVALFLLLAVLSRVAAWRKRT